MKLIRKKMASQLLARGKESGSKISLTLRCSNSLMRLSLSAFGSAAFLVCTDISNGLLKASQMANAFEGISWVIGVLRALQSLHLACSTCDPHLEDGTVRAI